MLIIVGDVSSHLHTLKNTKIVNNLTKLTEVRDLSKNTNRSCANIKWVIRGETHRGWRANLFSSCALFKNLERTSIIIMNKYWQIKSHCLNLFLPSKKPVSSPFITKENLEEVVIYSCIHVTNIREKL